MITAEAAAAKWKNKLGQAGAAYEDGVRNPKRSPTEAAIAAKPLWQAGVERAAANGDYERGLQRSGDEGWRRGALEKGKARLATGAAAAESKTAAAFRPLFAHIEQAVRQLPPRGDRETNRNRMNQMFDSMSSYQKPS